MEENADTKKKRPKKFGDKKKRFLVLVIALVTLIGGGVGGWLYSHSSTSPVPQSINKQINFPIYYPDAKRLPSGYVLDKNSFRSPQKGVVIYSVIYDSNKKIVFSVQQKPSDSIIQDFYANSIPLRNHFNISLGDLEIGAFGSGKTLGTVASLTTKDGSWLIVTAPGDINQLQLEQVMNSLKR